MKKMAILEATPELLRELLHLPPGATLVSLCVPFDQPGVLQLKIEGAGWDTPEGSRIQQAPPGEAVRLDNGQLQVDWKLPKDAPKP